jgi:hypothetical protein
VALLDEARQEARILAQIVITAKRRLKQEESDSESEGDGDVDA